MAGVPQTKEGRSGLSFTVAGYILKIENVGEDVQLGARYCRSYLYDPEVEPGSIVQSISGLRDCTGSSQTPLTALGWLAGRPVAYVLLYLIFRIQYSLLPSIFGTTFHWIMILSELGMNCAWTKSCLSPEFVWHMSIWFIDLQCQVLSIFICCMYNEVPGRSF